MTTSCAIPVNESFASWHDLYRAAIFETDPAKIMIRIIEAERALVRRERQLFLRSGNERELNALNTALHALDAHRSCLELAA